MADRRRRIGDEPEPDPPGAIVARGYDRLGRAYEEWSRGLISDQRERHTEYLMRELPPGSSVLDLGCGSGQTLKRLSALFTVTGVDLSEEQIALARGRIPGVRLVVGDMTEIDFLPGSFTAVTAFYSITHVPRDRHARLLKRVFHWLQPGGLFAASLGSRGEPGAVERDWLGVPMYFSHWDACTNRKLVLDAGFEIIGAEVETTTEHGQHVSFLWVVARRP